jgi:hypothetical protein
MAFCLNSYSDIISSSIGLIHQSSCWVASLILRMKFPIKPIGWYKILRLLRLNCWWLLRCDWRNSADRRALSCYFLLLHRGNWALWLTICTSRDNSLWLDRGYCFNVLNVIHLCPLINCTWHDYVTSGRQNVTVKRIEGKWSFHHVFINNVSI